MSYLLNRLTLVILAVLISGCSIIAETEITGVVRDKGSIEAIYFCPRDNCTTKLSEFILTADESVHCALFDLDLDEVIDALKSKNIDVKLVVDNDNYEFVDHLKFAKQDTSSQLSHNKFCIIDNKRISTGSFNPTFNGANKNNNNLIILESKTLANNYEKEFQELWNEKFGKGEKVNNPIIYLNKTKTENYFCPEDNCGEKIKNILMKAEKEIYFMTFSFTHESIANALLLKNLDNISIKGIFEKRGSGSEYSKFNVLDYQGIKVRKDSNGGVMHHKVFIIDNNTVITGSFNPSKNADTRNDENILIIYNQETAKKYLEEFKYIWENYTEK